VVVALIASLFVACTPSASETATPSTRATPAQLRDAVARTTYEPLVQELAALRTPHSPGWQAAQDRCAEVLTASGFTVERQDFGVGINVVGTKLGSGAQPDAVILGAHYDHIEGCTGADDNASGVAGVLEAARLLGAQAWDRDLIIACWDQEELGLLGSDAWVTAHRAQAVAAYLNFDMIGVASDEPGSQVVPAALEAIAVDQVAVVHADGDRANFIALIADREGSSDTVATFGAHADAIGLLHLDLTLDHLARSSSLTGDLRRSDHASFWAADKPAIFFTDTANFRYDGYHCYGAPDEVSRLNLDFAVQVVAATVGTAAELLGEPAAR